MLAIAGGKGGCGKTTTALGLAAAAVRQRKSAIVADADREMPNLHAMAGVARTPGLDAVAEGWPARFVADTADAPASGVGVIPAMSNLTTETTDSTAETTDSTTETTDSTTETTDSTAETTLDRIRGRADAVLLDCPAGAGPDAITPLRVADAVVVVTTTEPACLRDAAKTAAMARELGTTVAGAVASRTGDDQLTSVTDLLDCQILGTVPNTPHESPLVADRARAEYDDIMSILFPKYL